MKIAILVGHGKSASNTYDSGAINKELNLQEFLICKEIAKSANSFLQDYECAAELINYNGDKNLKERIKYCNDNNFDVIIEIHLNAFTNKTAVGTEAYYYLGDKNGRKLADNICKAIAFKLDIPQRSNGIDDGGDKETTYFGIVRETKGTAILVETCFISTNKEAQKVDTLSEQIAVGKAIGQAIVDTYSLKKKTASTLPPIKPTEKLRRGFYRIGVFNDNTKNREDVKKHLDALRDIGYAVDYQYID